MPDCKGLIFRMTLNSYLSKHKSIEVRKSLRLLKRDSCSGCSECEWFWGAIKEDIDCLGGDHLKDMDEDFKYKIGVNGGFDYSSNDYDYELYFQRIDGSNRDFK